MVGILDEDGVGRKNKKKVVAPFVGMVIAMVSQSGSMVVTKAAMSDGFNKYVMAFYSFAISTFLLLPFAFFQFRTERPPLTFSILCNFFLLALVGCSAQIMDFVGIELSSPTLASAMLNLIPAFTFVLALIFRMEEVYWRRFSTQAKVLGTIVSIGGAFVVILFKGPPLFKSHSELSSNNLLQFSEQVNWILGGFFCVGDSFLSSIWYIYQASITKKYPAVMVIVFFQMLFQTMQSAIFSLFAVRDSGAWVLRLDMGLVSVLYQAIGANVIRILLLTWCVRRAGPLFCAMFKPIGIVFTVFIGALFLGNDFYLGSFIGALLIAVGFYVVMWGKPTEENEVERGIEHMASSMCHNVPLLQNKT